MDQSLVDWVVAHRTAWLDHLAFALKAIGQSIVSFLAVVVTTAVVTFRRRQWAWGLAVTYAAVGALVASAVGKAAIRRPRPPRSLALLDADGWAMPSSVALLCAALGVAVIAGWDGRGRPHRWWSVAIVVATAALFGWAVVYLGAHWPGDVLVGWAVGIVVGAVAVAVSRPTADWVQGRWPERFPDPGRELGSDAVGHAQEA